MLFRSESHLWAARLSQIDYDREMAFVAEDADGEVLGVARIAGDPQNEEAEFALMVRSDRQRLPGPRPSVRRGGLRPQARPEARLGRDRPNQPPHDAGGARSGVQDDAVRGHGLCASGHRAGNLTHINDDAGVTF